MGQIQLALRRDAGGRVRFAVSSSRPLAGAASPRRAPGSCLGAIGLWLGISCCPVLSAGGFPPEAALLGPSLSLSLLQPVSLLFCPSMGNVPRGRSEPGPSYIQHKRDPLFWLLDLEFALALGSPRPKSRPGLRACGREQGALQLDLPVLGWAGKAPRTARRLGPGSPLHQPLRALSLHQEIQNTSV